MLNNAASPPNKYSLSALCWKQERDGCGHMHVFACFSTLQPAQRCGFAQRQPRQTATMQQSLRKGTCICRRIRHTSDNLTGRKPLRMGFCRFLPHLRRPFFVACPHSRERRRFSTTHRTMPAGTSRRHVRVRLLAAASSEAVQRPFLTDALSAAGGVRRRPLSVQQWGKNAAAQESAAGRASSNLAENNEPPSHSPARCRK